MSGEYYTSTPERPCLTLSPDGKALLSAALAREAAGQIEPAHQGRRPAELAVLLNPDRIQRLRNQLQQLPQGAALFPLSDREDTLALGMLMQMCTNTVGLQMVGERNPKRRDMLQDAVRHLLFISVQLNLLMHLHGTSVNAEAARMTGISAEEQMADMQAELEARRASSQKGATRA